MTERERKLRQALLDAADLLEHFDKVAHGEPSPKDKDEARATVKAFRKGLKQWLKGIQEDPATVPERPSDPPDAPPTGPPTPAVPTTPGGIVLPPSSGGTP